ncbi:MAG TPA: hypothetical protein DC024_10435 [Clostridiales bacterium]|jgi:uncharacterized protein with PIN domain|nr:hypothetical protein [Clostridiales bacterium]
MKYCPKCHHNFSDSFDICVYCETPLISGENPNPIEVDPHSTNNKQEIHSSIRECEKFFENNNQKYQVHCPACGSPNVEKISAASKIGHGLAFGLFSLGTISKTYHCKNCGVKF